VTAIQGSTVYWYFEHTFCYHQQL